MRPTAHLSCLTLLCILVSPLTARAGDDDDLLGGDDDEPAPARPTDPDDEIKTEDDEGELDKLDGVKGEDGDLLEDEEVKGPKGAGVDTDAIYRAQVAKMAEQEPDEELMQWEAYLVKFPNSLYKDRIQKRMDALEEQLYGTTKKPEGTETNADEAEVLLSVPLQLDSINPRQKFSAGFEWGLPDYINLAVDYEHPFARNFSIHGGIRHFYTGWRVGAGVKYAIVKSTRTQTLVTALGDIGINTNPAFPVLRPQIAVGHKFGDIVDLQAQGGVEIDTRKLAGVRGIGGVNATFHASDTVAIFLETGLYMQSVKAPQGGLGYRFNTASLGMKFMPALGNNEPGKLEINIGASVPYTSQYWSFHYGSIMGQFNYFFD